MLKVEEYIGKKYGRLTVLRELGKNKHNDILIEVKCDCEKGTIFTTMLYSVKTGKTKSCGCSRLGNKNNKKYNTYDLTGDFGIGYDCNNNKEFYFDLEDYDKIKDICWHVTNEDRVLGSYKNGTIEMSKIITHTKSEVVDHIFHNKKDSRKENLRIVTQQQNIFNRRGWGKLSEFGLKGIGWRKKEKEWSCRIQKDGKKIYEKQFKSITDAINKRIELEKECFGEYRYVWENNIKWKELLEYEKELKNNSLIDLK